MSIESRINCAVNTRPITITGMDYSNYIKFISSKEASITISCSEKTIQRILNGIGVSKNKYKVTIE